MNEQQWCELVGTSARVVAHTIHLGGPEYGEGEVIGYCAAPTVLIRRPDGSAFHWRADMCTTEPPRIIPPLGVPL